MRKIIFLIPFYNEEENLIKLAELIHQSSVRNLFEYKLIFLNDCSNDNSFQIISDYVKNKTLKNLIIYENEKNLGHGKSVLKLFNLANKFLENSTDIVTMDSDMKISYDDFNQIFAYKNSVICKRKRFEEGIFRAFITLTAEVLVFIKTGKFWRDANCPFRLYKIEDFKLISSIILKDLLTPNIVSTIIFIKYNIAYSRKIINLNYEIKNSGVTWQGKNPISKYLKILGFSYKSSIEVLTLKM
jgi:glycosyltransferase involved in cell wall biosynthesis